MSVFSVDHAKPCCFTAPSRRISAMEEEEEQLLSHSNFYNRSQYTPVFRAVTPLGYLS